MSIRYSKDIAVKDSAKFVYTFVYKKRSSTQKIRAKLEFSLFKIQMVLS